MKHLDEFVRDAEASITSVDVRTHRREGRMTLDVRDHDELQKFGGVAGALHIPRGRLELAADPFEERANFSLLAALETHAVIDILSSQGRRAALATQTLQAMGYKARHVKGGIKALKHDERYFPDLDVKPA